MQSIQKVKLSASFNSTYGSKSKLEQMQNQSKSKLKQIKVNQYINHTSKQIKIILFKGIILVITQGRSMSSFDQQDQITLKTKSWKALNQGFKDLKFTIRLSKGQENAKHQMLTLSIQIISESEEVIYFKKFKTSQLPSEAITIFADVETLYDYIEQSHKDSSRIKFFFADNLFTVVNIVLMKNKQIKQQIGLYLNKQKYVIQRPSSSIVKSFLDTSRISSSSNKQILQESKLLTESLIRNGNAQIQSKISIMNQNMQNLIQEIKFLKKQNKVTSNALNQCNMTVFKLQKQNSRINQKLSILQNQKANRKDIKNSQANISTGNQDQRFNELYKQISDNKWHIDQIAYSFQNMKQQHNQLQKIKVKFQEHSKIQPKNDYVLPLFNQLKKEVYVLNNKYTLLKQNTSRLGEKINLSIDFENNPYLSNFRFVQNIIQKISGDEQRHQILGRENINILTLKRKSYFQIKIVSTISAGIVIGIVGEAKKGQRYSYDKKQCVCYDGKGFIFQQGHKIKMPCKLDNGQTVRVVLDPIQCIIHWYVGYTQIGSTFIPESMKKMRVVPYFQLYDRNDKVAFNG